MEREDLLKDYDIEFSFKLPNLKARYRLAKIAYGNQDSYGWLMFGYYMFACFIMEITFHVSMNVPWWVSYTGWLAVFIGLSLVSGAQRLANQSAARRGKPGKLCRRGIYHFSRHPMYIGFVLIPFGLGLAQDLFWFLMMSVPLVFLYQLHVIPREEKRLLTQWGDSYREYMKDVPRWL